MNLISEENTFSLIDRKTVEMDLNFLGLMVMQNQLKPESKPVIYELNKANIRTVMITGESVD